MSRNEAVVEVMEADLLALDPGDADPELIKRRDVRPTEPHTGRTYVCELAPARRFLAGTLTLFLVACGGGGSETSAGLLPMLNVSGSTVTEGDSGNADLVFEIVLASQANGSVNVDYTTEDGTAVANSDYVPSSGTLTIPAGTTAATAMVSVIGDTDVEVSEKFSLVLSNVSPNAVLGTSTAVAIIENDDLRNLNDTGIVTCADGDVRGLECPQTNFPRQDAEHGRDEAANDDTDGRAGFSFTKLDSAGNPLGNQTLEYATLPWACVQDAVSGLVWEVKTADGGLQDSAATYSWYSSGGSDGGGTGVQDGGICSGSACDTESYADAVNALALCGFEDWRLPSLEELRSFADYGGVSPGWLVDGAYFPNTWPADYWSSSPSAADAGDAAWILSFSTGEDLSDVKGNPHHVRLVHGSR